MKHWDWLKVVNYVVIVISLTLFIFYGLHQLKIRNVIKQYEVSIETLNNLYENGLINDLYYQYELETILYNLKQLD